MASANDNKKLSGRNLRLLGAAAVVALAVGAFAAGVGTTGIADMGAESLAGWLYFAGGLFVFGGLDLGTPVGGPQSARIALWIAYFLAPAITTTVIAENVGVSGCHQPSPLGGHGVRRRLGAGNRLCNGRCRPIYRRGHHRPW